MTSEFIVSGLFVALGCLLLWGILRAARPQPFFTLRLKNGETKVLQGRVKPSFVAVVTEVASEHEVSDGTVRGFADRKLIKLRFSSSFPPPAQQKLRNVWASSY